jgi:hypothetical protein
MNKKEALDKIDELKIFVNECDKEEPEDKRKFGPSLLKALSFYGFLSLLFIIVYLIKKDLGLGLILVFSFNFVIALTTQCLHYWLGNKLWFYEKFSDCFVRCFAGVLEMVLYTLFFIIDKHELIVGYLVLKTVSIWKGKQEDKEQIKEGQSTAVLRIAVVLSLVFSYIIYRVIILVPFVKTDLGSLKS